MTSASGGPKGAAPPDARSSPPGARPSSSARRPWPAAGRSRRPVRQPGGSSAMPRPRQGTGHASRSARPRSQPGHARPAPGPRPAGAAAPSPACVAPTSAAAARAWTRLRQRGGRAPPGPRPPQRSRPPSTSLQSLTCKAVSQRNVGRGSLDPALATTIHERRFRQLVREGAVAPAYMIDRFSRLRRRATLAAQVLELQARLTDAAVDLLDRLVGTLFAKDRRGRQRRYQASAGDVGRLMGLFGGTISALQAARERDADPFALLDETVGWWRLLQAKPQVDAFAELARTDPLPAAGEKYATLRRF